MFGLSLQPIAPDVAKTWLIRCGVAVGGSGLISISTLVDRIRQMFPKAVLEQLPNYEQFIYMALAIAFVTALPLVMFRKVVCLSLAQMGYASGLQYLGFSLLGVFVHGYGHVLIGLMVLLAILFVILFSDGLKYYLSLRSWSDVALSIVFLAFFCAVWLFPAWMLWRHV